MNKNVLFSIVSIVFLACVVAPVHGGEVYCVENSKGNIPVIIQKNPYSLGPVPELMERKCEGFSFGLLYRYTDGSIGVWKGEIAPNGTISQHHGNNTWVCYIIEGSGEVLNADHDLKVYNTIQYGPGDVLAFRPDAMHAWKNGPKKTVFIAVEQVVP